MLSISYNLHIKLKAAGFLDALDDLPFPYDSFLFLNITAYLVHCSTNLLLIKNFLYIMRKVYCFFSLIIFLHLIPRPGFCHHLRRHTFSVVPLRSLYQTNFNDKKIPLLPSYKQSYFSAQCLPCGTAKRSELPVTLLHCRCCIITLVLQGERLMQRAGDLFLTWRLVLRCQTF